MRKIFERKDCDIKNNISTDVNSSHDHDSEDDDNYAWKYDNKPSAKSSATSVHAGNVAFKYSWQHIKNVMHKARNVLQSKAISFEDGRSKGGAIVAIQEPKSFNVLSEKFKIR